VCHGPRVGGVGRPSLRDSKLVGFYFYGPIHWPLNSIVVVWQAQNINCVTPTKFVSSVCVCVSAGACCVETV
jgi:hypothetical protein